MFQLAISCSNGKDSCRYELVREREEKTSCEILAEKMATTTGATEKERHKKIFYHSLPHLDWLLDQKSQVPGPKNERL